MITKKQLLEAIEKATYDLDIPHPTPNLFRDIKLVVEALPDESTECEHDWKPIYGSRKLDDRTTFFDGPLVRYDCTKCGISKCAQEETKPDWEKKFDDEFDYLDEPIRLSGGHDYITHRGEMLTKGIKDFIRAELKAMGEEIKRYIDINYDHESALLYSLVDEALRKRGI